MFQGAGGLPQRGANSSHPDHFFALIQKTKGCLLKRDKKWSALEVPPTAGRSGAIGMFGSTLALLRKCDVGTPQSKSCSASIGTWGCIKFFRWKPIPSLAVALLKKMEISVASLNFF